MGQVGLPAGVRIGVLVASLILGQFAAPPPAACQAKVALLDLVAACGQPSDGVELRALARMFSTLGIRAEVLSAAGAPQALDAYRVVFAAGALRNAEAASGLANALYDYVEAGGVLVYAGEAGSVLYPLFGVTGRSASRSRLRLTFSGQDTALSLLAHPRLREISLGNGQPPFFKEVIWSHGAALDAGACALGRFEDGSVGFSVNVYGRGRAYLLGLSYTESVLLPQTGGSYNAERQYVNGIEPSADALLLLLKAVWANAVSPAVCLATAPYARPTALLLTHDVDAQTSFVDSLKFAGLEKKYGVKSTFFINTKTFSDEMDIDYFNVPENREAVRQLGRLGWDVGSHTVAHSRKLASAPEGQPGVTRRSYDPRRGLTVWGEVKVSKELLDAELPGRATVAYRSGELAFPPSLIRILQAAGYLYDSTYSANAVLTAFPFLALEEQHVRARESAVVEIPVTLDDSQGFLTPATLPGAVQKWTEVLRANARYGGITVLLIHPSDTRTQDFKLRAQESLMQEAVRLGAWMGDLSTFGRFWARRAALEFAAGLAADGTLEIRVAVREADLEPALGFEVGGFTGTVRVVDSQGRLLDFSATTREGRVYLARSAR
jgi:peptidoglycan/xylan/chitin deacetylase (PgdA/CDA1 family)